MKDIVQSNTYRETIGFYDNTEFYRVGNNLFFGDDKVHPEFENLMRLNFITHTSIRFNNHSYKKENSDQKRYDLITELFSPLNIKIKRKFPDIETGKHSFRYCWVNEYGASNDEVHMHILGYIKPEVADLAYLKTYNFLRYLEKKNIQVTDSLNPKLKIEPIESIHTRKVTFQAGIVSYFCKIEPTAGQDSFKKIGYSMGFRSVIEKYYSPDSSKGLLNNFLSNSLVRHRSDDKNEPETPFCSFK